MTVFLIIPQTVYGGACKEIHVLLVILLEHHAAKLFILHAADVLYNGVEAELFSSGVDVCAAARAGDIAQHLLVEAGDDDVPFLVPQEFSVHGDGLAFGRTYADGIYLDAQFRSLLGGPHGVVLMVLAVGDDHNER